MTYIPILCSSRQFHYQYSLVEIFASEIETSKSIKILPRIPNEYATQHSTTIEEIKHEKSS
jgi:hypothetical protein